LTNLPFGKKSSITVFNDDGKADKEKVVYRHDDF
jgi:type I restriction enzyme M protein